MERLEAFERFEIILPWEGLGGKYGRLEMLLLLRGMFGLGIFFRTSSYLFTDGESEC